MRSGGGFGREAGSDRLEVGDQLLHFGIGEGVVRRLSQLVGKGFDLVLCPPPGGGEPAATVDQATRAQACLDRR
jgi:hypothetical protein